jgi:hypothetical protein
MADLRIRIDGSATVGEARRALLAFTDSTMQKTPAQSVDDAFGLAIVPLYCGTLQVGEALVKR